MNTQRMLATRGKEQRALELAKAGATYQAIAEQLGWRTHSAAVKAVRRALDRTTVEGANEYRQLQLARLNTYRLALWPKVRDGNVRAIEVAIKIEEREARLLGLDAPEQVEQHHEITVWLKNVDLDAL